MKKKKNYRINFKTINIIATSEKEAEEYLLNNLDKLEISYIDEEEIHEKE